MKPIVLVLFGCIGLSSFAQQDPLTTLFWNNYSVFNPATSGLEHRHHAAVSYRAQWSGITGAPTTLFANYNTKIGRRHGVGGHYTNETIGNMKSNYLHLNYNYQYKTEGGKILSVGISPGFSHSSFVDNWIAPTNEPDPSIPSSSESTMNFNGGIAIKGKNIFAGLGVTHFVTLFHRNESQSFNLAPHYYAHFRFKKWLNRRLKMHLEGLFRTDAIKYSFDLNSRIMIFNRLTFGVGLRFTESYIAHVGWTFSRKFHLNYSYDWAHTNFKLQEYSKGSHEFSLGYVIQHKGDNFRPLPHGISF